MISRAQSLRHYCKTFHCDATNIFRPKEEIREQMAANNILLLTMRWFQRPYHWSVLQSCYNRCLSLCYSNTMYMLVKIGHFVITTQLSGSPVSFLSQQLGNCLISVKRLFDKFIVSHWCAKPHITLYHSHTDYSLRNIVTIFFAL